MNRPSSFLFLVLILGLSLSAMGGATGEVIRIQVRVFQGTRAEGGAGFKEDVVLTASSTPAFVAEVAPRASPPPFVSRMWTAKPGAKAVVE